MLAGLLAPTAGRAWVDGVALPGRAAVGLISHHSMLYPALTGRENVEFAAQLYGVAEPRGAVERALDMMGVLERADVPVRQLSRGLQQRVSIARAFVHGPRVVLLDEPFSGLDAAGAQVLARALGELKVAGAAMVLVTHNFDEGLGLATQTLVMRDGRPVRAERRGDVDPVEFGAWYRAEVVL
jgi:heme exporter protein A